MHCKEIFSSLTLALLLLIFVTVPDFVMAQSVICQATVEATRLTPKEQNDLRNLARSMESYINEFEYTDESYDVTFEMKRFRKRDQKNYITLRQLFQTITTNAISINAGSSFTDRTIRFITAVYFTP